MNMQCNRIAAAVAACAALTSGAALALPATDTPDIEIFMSGATAQDNNLGLLFEDLCVPGSLTTYQDGTVGGTDKAGANHLAYFCQIDSSKVTGGISVSNPKVLLHKTSTSGGVGGSGIGVNPVLLKQEVETMSIKNNNCADAPINGEKFVRCGITQPGDLVMKVPDAGVSDVNPELFTGPNTPKGVAPVDASKVAQSLQVISGGSLVFNTPVTLKLRNALQQAQLDSGALPNDCAVGNETEKCMPGLSKQQVASLLTGQIQNWEQIKVVTPNGASKPLTDYAGNGDITDRKVYICRRTAGSGTQATINAKILNAPCTAGSVNPIETTNPALGPVVLLNAGSGDVEKCLVDFDAGSNTSTQNANAVKAWAIGVQSTEKNSNETLAYRFIKIDGVAPTLANAASGHYSVNAELTYQFLKSGGPTGDKLNIIKQIANEAGKPSVIAKNNAKFVHLFGEGGYLAVSANGFDVPADGVFSKDNPVTPYTHAPGGLSLDNCRVPLIDNGKANPL
jgi:hypothetical protein